MIEKKEEKNAPDEKQFRAPPRQRIAQVALKSNCCTVGDKAFPLNFPPPLAALDGKILKLFMLHNYERSYR